MCFVAMMLVGCGRLGFDEKKGGPGTEAGSSGSGSGGNAGGDGGPGDGPAAGCVYLACAAPDVSCCTNNVTTCTPPGACTGTVIPCDVNPPYAPCAVDQGCCLASDGGLACIGPPTPC